MDDDVGRDGRRDIVIFIAIGAGQIAAKYGNDVRHDGMAGGQSSMGDQAQLTHSAGESLPIAIFGSGLGRHTH